MTTTFITPLQLADRLKEFMRRPTTGPGSPQNQLMVGLMTAQTWNQAARIKLRDSLNDLETAVCWGVLESLSPDHRAALRPLADTLRGSSTEHEMLEKIVPFYHGHRCDPARHTGQ